MRVGFIAHNDLESIEADCRFAVEYDFSGLEFNYWNAFRDLTPETVTRMRAILDRHGIACSTLGLWGWNHIARDQAERDESHRQLERAIQFAQTLGAPILITGGGRLADASLEENVQTFAEVMRPFIDRAAATGIRIALYGFHGGSFLTSVRAYESLWEQVGDVGIKLDPANVDHAGEDYLAILRHHGKRVFHVHIKEHLTHAGELAAEPAAGMGDIAWGKVMAFLYESDYQGYLTIEPHGQRWGREPLRSTMLVLSQRHISQFLL